MTANHVKHQDENGNKFETAREIEINKNIVKFGTSVYQFKNVTGFEVGIIPKNKFPLLLFIILTVFSLLVFTINSIISSIFPEGEISKSGGFQLFILLGFLAFLIDVCICIVYVSQSTKYGLTIYLNSGQNSVFMSQHKIFLMDIVNSLYSFMKEDEEKSLLIDMSNRSITVGGSIHGPTITGNENVLSK